MDNSQYICFCRKLFPNQLAFKAHLPCNELVDAIHRNAKFGIVPTKNRKELSLIQGPFSPTTEAIIKVTKLKEDISKVKEVNEIVPPLLTHQGKRLPSRTKVPYLSRAVPLSTDHSFERCTCGAVFVTRVGKRQHQARFCVLAKNKSKNKCANNVMESLMDEIQIVSSSNLGLELNETTETTVSDIYNEQSFIHYEVDENCAL